MSWSFQAVGKNTGVAKAAREAAENGGKPYCAEPEETHRKDALETIARFAEGIVGSVAIQVTASGSMWKDGDTVKSHSMALEFRPLSGFVE